MGFTLLAVALIVRLLKFKYNIDYSMITVRLVVKLALLVNH